MERHRGSDLNLDHPSLEAIRNRRVAFPGRDQGGSNRQAVIMPITCPMGDDLI